MKNPYPTTVDYCVSVIEKLYPEYINYCLTVQNSALLARYFSAILAPKSIESKREYKKILKEIKSKELKTITASNTVKKHFFLIRYFSCAYNIMIKRKL